MNPIVTIVDVGKYKFHIIDDTSIYEGRILSRNFKIGGDYDDCVNVSIDYSDESLPISATMHNVGREVDISLGGSGSVIMIKTLLEHVHQQIPTLTEVEFKDFSHIESSNIELASKYTRVIPIQLCYFSIAFNGLSWYENHFHAKLKDPRKYEIYREKVQQLLYSPEFKTNTTFIMFLQCVVPPMAVVTDKWRDKVDKLEEYYNKSVTFGDFFQLIPFTERIHLVRDWIETFMIEYLNDACCKYDNWVIELPVGKSLETNGPIEIDNKTGKTQKYYCPKGRIHHYMFSYCLGVDPCDV